SGQVSDLLAMGTSGRYLPGQSRTYASAAMTCRAHRRLPVSRSNAITASDVFAAGAGYAVPAAPHTAWRVRTIAGDDATPAPAGTQSCVSFDVFLIGTARSAMV